MVAGRPQRHHGHGHAVRVPAQHQQASQPALRGRLQRVVQRHHVRRVAGAQLASQQLQRVLGVEFAARRVVQVLHLPVAAEQQHAVVDLVEHQLVPARQRRHFVGIGRLARQRLRIPQQRWQAQGLGVHVEHLVLLCLPGTIPVHQG